MIAVAAFAAWAGGAVIVLADARRGQAVGLAILTAGVAGCVLAGGQDLAAGILLAGGAVAGALRFRAGPAGWGLMQPGSTPRVVLVVAAGIIALYFAASVATGAGAGTRFALLVVIGLAAARVLEGNEPASALTAASALALAIGATAALAEPSGLAAAVVAAVIAAGVPLLPQPQARTDGA